MSINDLEFFRNEILGDLGWSDDEPEPEGELTWAKTEIRRLQRLADDTTVKAPVNVALAALRIAYRMRQAQKEYFKPGGQLNTTLSKAKRLEAEFDKTIEKIIADASRIQEAKQLALGEQEQTTKTATQS